MGDIVMFEKPMINGSLGRSLIDARFLLNLGEPFSLGFWVPREKKKKKPLPGSQSNMKDYRTKCRHVGHEGWGCEELKKQSEDEEAEYSYGNWLCTPSVKTLDDALEVYRWDWVEASCGDQKSRTTSAHRSMSPKNPKDNDATQFPRRDIGGLRRNPDHDGDKLHGKERKGAGGGTK